MNVRLCSKSALPFAFVGCFYEGCALLLISIRLYRSWWIPTSPRSKPIHHHHRVLMLTFWALCHMERTISNTSFYTSAWSSEFSHLGFTAIMCLPNRSSSISHITDMSSFVSLKYCIRIIHWATAWQQTSFFFLNSFVYVSHVSFVQFGSQWSSFIRFASPNDCLLFNHI